MRSSISGLQNWKKQIYKLMLFNKAYEDENVLKIQK